MNRKIILLIIATTGNVFLLYSQHNLTMYNMHTLPQRIQANPAQISDSRFFVSMPGLSSVHVLYGNNGFKVKNLVSVTDSNKLRIHPLNFYNALNKDNSISVDLDYDLFFLGFKIRKSFFTLSLGEKVRTQVSFPKDFFGLLVIGNGGSNLGKELNFNFGYDMMIYNDISATYSRSFIKDKLRVGAKFSYLNGLVNVNTVKSDFFFKTHPEDFHYTVRTDIHVNTSTIVDTLNRTFEAENFDPNILKSKNRGRGLSFGATYQLTKRFVLTASVIDIGYIDWVDNVQNYKTADPSKDVEFYGLKFSDLFTDSADYNETINDFTDTLKENFKIKSTYETYRTALPSTFYLGGNYWITKRHNFGLLMFGKYYQKKFEPAITLSYNGKLTRVLGVSVSYSMINKSFVNGGVGFTINGGPFQYYAVADNLLGIVKFRNANTIDFRTGINFTFRRKDKQPVLSGKAKKLG